MPTKPSSHHNLPTPPQPVSPLRRRGVLPLKSVRIAAFGIISCSIFISVVICLLAIWELAASDTGWRALASLATISAGTVAFVIVNEIFGRSLGPNQPLQPDTPPAQDA